MTHEVLTRYRAYLALWNATTAEDRRRLLAAAVTEEADLIYPRFACHGVEEIIAALAGLHDRWPGIQFRQASGIEEHHGWLRVGWRMERAAGELVMAGVDIAAVAADGRFRLVLGFHDPLPPVE